MEILWKKFKLVGRVILVFVIAVCVLDSLAYDGSILPKKNHNHLRRWLDFNHSEQALLRYKEAIVEKYKVFDIKEIKKRSYLERFERLSSPFDSKIGVEYQQDKKKFSLQLYRAIAEEMIFMRFLPVKDNKVLERASKGIGWTNREMQEAVKMYKIDVRKEISYAQKIISGRMDGFSIAQISRNIKRGIGFVNDRILAYQQAQNIAGDTIKFTPELKRVVVIETAKNTDSSIFSKIETLIKNEKMPNGAIQFALSEICRYYKGAKNLESLCSELGMNYEEIKEASKRIGILSEEEIIVLLHIMPPRIEKLYISINPKEETMLQIDIVTERRQQSIGWMLLEKDIEPLRNAIYKITGKNVKIDLITNPSNSITKYREGNYVLIHKLHSNLHGLWKLEKREIENLTLNTGL